jgi:acyl-CoA reductase-like NAD-dependent aldehyde dehydrogenase
LAHIVSTAVCDPAVAGRTLLEVDWISLLQPYRKHVVAAAAAACRVGIKGADALWADLERYLSVAPQLVADLDARTALAAAQTTCINPRAVLRRMPWGTVMFTVPSNAPVPLAFIVPLSLLAVGNQVVIATPSSVRAVVEMLVEPLLTHAGPQRVTIAAGGVREALNDYIETGRADALYFTGSSEHFASVAQRCADAGVELIYEGSGNPVSIVDDTLDPADLDRVAAQVTRSLTFANGLVCTSPNVLTVHACIFDDVCRAIDRHYAHQPPSMPVDQLVSARSADDPDNMAWRIPSPSLKSAQHSEVFGPAVHVVRYADWDDLLADLRRERFRLQVALYSRSEARWRQLQSVTTFARYCWNMPSCDQDPALAWGNYGRSGSSAVADFMEKGVRSVIVEEGWL